LAILYDANGVEHACRCAATGTIVSFRCARCYAGKILGGSKPADLPVKFDLVVNLKTAKAIGIEPSVAIRLRADERIERRGASSSLFSAMPPHGQSGPLILMTLISNGAARAAISRMSSRPFRQSKAITRH
jgi:hypothetical protein